MSSFNTGHQQKRDAVWMKLTKSIDIFLLTAERWNNKPAKAQLQSALSKHTKPTRLLDVSKCISVSKLEAAENWGQVTCV